MTDTVTTRTDQTLREQLAAELHRIADDIVRLKLPVADLMSARLSVGVLNDRDDLDTWALYLGVEIDESGGSNEDIPTVDHLIHFDDKSWGPTLNVHAQIQPDRQVAK